MNLVELAEYKLNVMSCTNYQVERELVQLAGRLHGLQLSSQEYRDLMEMIDFLVKELGGRVKSVEPSISTYSEAPCQLCGDSRYDCMMRGECPQN